MRILLKTPLNSQTGYGNDGIGMARALTTMGADVYLDPSFVQAPLPRDVALLLTKRLEAPFDLCIQHADPDQLGISQGCRRSTTTTVAWTMWEFTSLDNAEKVDTLAERLDDFDLVVGYDTVTTDALSRYVSTASATVQGGFWPDQWPYAQRDWHADTFNFCMVGALHQRKDPFVAIQAYKELCEEDPDFAAGARLTLKTCEPGLHKKLEAWAPGLTVHYDMWPDQVLRAFYASQHVLLAPSRGEGKNLPALEFQSTGGAVIATNWGGHTQWQSGQYGYPLDYELKPLSAGTPDCRNARADKDHLKTLMRHVYTHRDEVSRKAQTASQVIPAMCAWDVVMDRFLRKVSEVSPTLTGAIHRLQPTVNVPVGAP